MLPVRSLQLSLLPLPSLWPVALIALDRQRAEALAHLVSNPPIAGVMDAPVATREASFRPQVLPVGCLLREHVANQCRNCTGNDRGVRDVGGMVRQWDQRHDRIVGHARPPPPIEV